MAAKTIAYRTDILNVVRGTNLTAPTAVYLALLSALSSDGSSGGTEIAAATRQPVTCTTAGSSGHIGNSTDILYPVASSAWATPVAAALWSSSGSSGYCYYTGAISGTAISSGDQAKVAAGAFTWQEI